jgi:uncharacterized protein (DUF934 family)
MANTIKSTSDARIIKNGTVQNDGWKVVRLSENDTPHTLRLPIGPLLVPVSVWNARRAELIVREYDHGWPLGVWLGADEGAESIAADLDDFSVIGVEFSKFTDGRGYSTARLLRERHAYKGELRAIGDIQRDQLFYLQRVGFDAFSLRPDKHAVDALAGFADFTAAYQNAVDAAQVVTLQRHGNYAGTSGIAAF